MKRILFVFPSFSIGGTTISTRHLISLLDKEGYDCYIMPLNAHGGLSQLYEGINSINTPFAIRVLGGGAWTYETSFLKRMGAMFYRIVSFKAIWLKRNMVNKAFEKLIKQYGFNTIVACQEAKTTEIVSYSKFDNKIAWVRCDYKRRMEDIGKKREMFYESFKAIVCVSEQTCQNFKQIFPEYESKTYCIPNPQDGEIILNRANLAENEPQFIIRGKTLVSIGRFDVVKRFDQIPSIAHRLRENGLKFRWYLIGDGPERQHINEAIHKYDVADYVIMLGIKNNPYFYLRQADAMVCLSRSEACPRVVNEAKILHVPTVSTDFPTIYEFIQEGKTGIIANLEEIPDAIKKLFSDEVLYKSIRENINEFVFDNNMIINQIKRIL